MGTYIQSLHQLSTKRVALLVFYPCLPFCICSASRSLSLCYPRSNVFGLLLFGFSLFALSLFGLLLSGLLLFGLSLFGLSLFGPSLLWHVAFQARYSSSALLFRYVPTLWLLYIQVPVTLSLSARSFDLSLFGLSLFRRVCSRSAFR